MRQELRSTIAQYSIPRGTVARLAGMHLPDLSGWLNGRTELNPTKAERVRETVTSIVEIIQAGRESGIDFNLRDPDNVARLITKATQFKDEATQAANEQAKKQLDAALGEAAAVFSLDLT